MKLAASQFLQKVLKENRIFLDIILNLCKSAFAAQDRGGIPSPSWRILIRAGRVEKSSLKARQQLNVNVGEGSYEDLDYRRRNRGGTRSPAAMWPQVDVVQLPAPGGGALNCRPEPLVKPVGLETSRA
jgi:hypothetical protein